MADFVESSRFCRRSNHAGQSLPGDEEAESGAGRSRESTEAGTKLCGSQATARAFAEFQASREKTRRCTVTDWFRPMQQSQSSRKWRLIAALAPLCLLLSVVILLRLPSVGADEHSAAGPFVLELSLDGEVEPILATYIDEGLADAERRHAALVLITMDTPGGLSDSMKDMIQHILVSPVPVAVYVSPTGARGASAGFYILLSADIAAMAPGTHTGAASPIIAIGGFPQQIDKVFPKTTNWGSLAFLRSFTEKRGRNPQLAESAVTDARAFTENEALDGKMIDLIASSELELLGQLNGREITRFDGTKVKLELANCVRVSFHLSGRQRFLARIVAP